MKQLHVLTRPLLALLALFTLLSAVVAQVPHGSSPTQIAGDDPKIPTGG